jgi:hypothetical protein
MPYTEFCKRYDDWLAASLGEFNERYGENRTLHCVPDDCDYDPGDVVEFSEDGDAYPHGAGGTGHIRKAVTPWRESEFFVE